MVFPIFVLLCCIVLCSALVCCIVLCCAWVRTVRVCLWTHGFKMRYTNFCLEIMIYLQFHFRIFEFSYWTNSVYAITIQFLFHWKYWLASIRVWVPVWYMYGKYLFFYLIYRKFAEKGYEALSINIRLLWRVSNHLREFYLQSNENQKATENWFNIFLSLSMYFESSCYRNTKYLHTNTILICCCRSDGFCLFIC